MAKYRKKPIVVEAEQFLSIEKPPQGLILWPDETGSTPRDMSFGFVVTIHNQRAHIMAGDWIIQEPDGEHYYPCKPVIFEATYEKVD